MSPRRRTATAVATTLVAAALLGCGAPTDGARAIDGDVVPYGLLSPSPSRVPTTAETAPTAGDVTVNVFFVGPDDLLVPVPVALTEQGLTDRVRQVLAVLEGGPRDSDRDVGLGTALGLDIELRLIKVLDTTAYVDLALSTRQPAADQIPLAVGQVVLSVASVTGVSDVLLLIDGEEVDVPLPGGQRTSGPVTAGEYESLVAASISDDRT